MYIVWHYYFVCIINILYKTRISVHRKSSREKINVSKYSKRPRLALNDLIANSCRCCNNIIIAYNTLMQYTVISSFSQSARTRFTARSNDKSAIATTTTTCVIGSWGNKLPSILIYSSSARGVAKDRIAGRRKGIY